MRLGIIYDDTIKHFLTELLADWREHFNTSIYEFEPVTLPVASGRINPILHRRTLKKFLNQNDIVFFEWVGENLMLASHLPHQAKLIARLHSWELFHFAQWVNWSAVDRIILVSQTMQDRFNNMYPENAGRTTVLPAGKSLTQFEPDPHVFGGKIALLGHLIPIKRIYEMILTLKELHERGYQLTLHLGGEPKGDFVNQRYYASVLELISKLGLGDFVFFDGWVDPRVWLPEKDIYVSLSYWEGQQNTLLEAMASGCYCLCHFWGGAEEILPEEYLFSSETNLIDKIIQYVDMPEDEKKREQQRIHAIAAEKFDLVKSIEGYRRLIEEVWENGKMVMESGQAAMSERNQP